MKITKTLFKTELEIDPEELERMDQTRLKAFGIMNVVIEWIKRALK